MATYVILLQALHSELAALAIAEAIPVAWMLAIGLPRRRVPPLALVWALVLAVAVLVSIVAGGSVLPLKLRRAVITGSLGLAFLGSVLVRRPLLPVAMDQLARAWPRTERLTRLLGGQTDPRRARVLTAILGVTLLADATAQVTLALTVSTAAFLLSSRLARLAVFAVGLGGCASYLRRLGSREPGARTPSPGPRGTPRLGAGTQGRDVSMEATLDTRALPRVGSNTEIDNKTEEQLGGVEGVGRELTPDELPRLAANLADPQIVPGATRPSIAAGPGDG